MKRTLVVIGSVVGLLLGTLVAFFFWASAGPLPDDALAQTRQYETAPAPAPETLTVTTYNLGYLSGMTNNEPVVRAESLFANNMDRAVRLLRRADSEVIGVQEIDFGAARSFYVQQLDTIATRLSYATAAQAVNWDERYLPFPYGRPAVHFGRVVSGQAVLSRFPVRAHRRYVLPRPPQPFYRSAFYLDRLAQVALLDLGGRPLLVVNVHLEAYHQATRVEQARAVRALYDRLAATGAPVLLVGDFNATWASSAPAADSGQDEGSGAEDGTLHALLHDTPSRATHPDSATQAAAPTFPADAPTRKIDHIFYPEGSFERVGRAVRCGTPPPSDHCAVTASLRLRPDTAGSPPVDSVAAALPPAGPWPR